METEIIVIYALKTNTYILQCISGWYEYVGTVRRSNIQKTNIQKK